MSKQNNFEVRAWRTACGDTLLWFDDGDYRCLMKCCEDIGLILSYPGPWEYFGSDLDYLLDDDVELSKDQAMQYWMSAKQEHAALISV